MLSTKPMEGVVLTVQTEGRATNPPRQGEGVKSKAELRGRVTSIAKLGGSVTSEVKQAGEAASKVKSGVGQ